MFSVESSKGKKENEIGLRALGAYGPLFLTMPVGGEFGGMMDGPCFSAKLGVRVEKRETTDDWKASLLLGLLGVVEATRNDFKTCFV